jgi:hypothetical protein
MVFSSKIMEAFIYQLPALLASMIFMTASKNVVNCVVSVFLQESKTKDIKNDMI